jgi:hypothetical protein
MSKQSMVPTRKRLYLSFSMAQVFFLFTFFVISQILLTEISTITTITTTKQEDHITIESLPVNSTKTAIVYLTKALDECRAVRLRHLLQTAPPNMDVWLLHNHNLIGNQNKLTTSLDHVRRLERDYVLFNSSQANKKVEEFDDQASGPAKSSFLRWVIQHPEYKHAWHMEDDVFFTGSWNNFFDQADANADFVGVKIRRIDGWEYFRATRCSMDPTYIPSYNNTKRSKNISTDHERILCRNVLTWRSLWSIVRLSNQYAQFLLEDVESGTLHGHHEAVVQGVLLGHANLTSVDLPPLKGYYTPGGWGKFKNRSICSLDLYQPIQHNRYYHPVKCEAYAGEKLDHFKEIMIPYGWSNGSL